MILISSSLIANANIGDLLLTSDQVSALQSINNKINDTLTSDERFDLLTQLVEKRKYKTIASLDRNDLYDLVAFYRKTTFDHVDAKHLPDFIAALNQKSKEFVEMRRSAIVEKANEIGSIDENLLQENLQKFVGKVLEKTAVQEEWTKSNVDFYDFNHFDKYAIAAVAGRSEVIGDELWDKWMEFILLNSDKRLF